MTVQEVAVGKQFGTLAYVPPDCLYCKVYEDAPVIVLHESVMLEAAMFVGGEFRVGADGTV